MKKNIFKRTIYLLIISALHFSVSAQDFRYSAVFENPLQLNPGLMAKNSDFKIGVNHRNQWGSFGNAYYTTSSATILFPFYLEDNGKLDFGLNIIMDAAGAFKTNLYSLSIGYSLKVSKFSNLGLSISGGFLQKKLDVSSLTFDSQYVLGSFDQSNLNNETILNNNVGTVDLNFGFIWFTDKFDNNESGVDAFVGVSGFHVTGPSETYTDTEGVLPSKYSVQGGIELMTGNDLAFRPNFIVTTQEGDEVYSTGMYVDYFLTDNKLSLGSWYRLKDGFSFLLKFEHEYIIAAYGYGFSSSILGDIVSGINTHEISLAFRLNMKQKNSDIETDGDN